jgi:prenyltransferase/squalene oxidase-like repeat protein
MKMRLAFSVLMSALLVSIVGAAEAPVPQQTLRTAVEKGLDLLVKTSPTFIKKGGCNSCHNQTLPAAAQAFAQRKGLGVGEPIAQLPAELSETTIERYVEYSVAGGAGVTFLGFDFFAKALARTPADARIDAQIHFVKRQQQPEGYWRGAGSLVGGTQPGGSRPASARPPLTFDDFTPTAYMIRALSTYARAVDAADTRTRIDRARAWLLATKAERTQERAFKLLGLTWSKADRRAIDDEMRALEALQREDGGWSQLPTLPSDAYATGIALFALYEAGAPVKEPVYQAGLKYLLSTQGPDGTWHVKSRALLFQPYFETGYPYGRDQWISAAGAAYATLAIAAAVER